MVSRVDEIEALVQEMINLDIYPNFITVDGGEGGTGQHSRITRWCWPPTFTALPIVTGVLERYDAQIYEDIRIWKTYYTR